MLMLEQIRFEDFHHFSELVGLWFSSKKKEVQWLQIVVRCNIQLREFEEYIFVGIKTTKMKIRLWITK